MTTAEPPRRPGRARLARIAAASALALAAGVIGIIAGQAGPPADGPDADRGGTSVARTTMATPEVVVVHGGIPTAGTTTDPPDVVAVWARMHQGWIFVYDDGRVLSHRDVGPILERHLSLHGVDLIRRGILAPQDLELYLSMTVPASAWSDPIPDVVLPERYAVCKIDADGTSQHGEVLGDVGSIWRRLPAEQQALFRAGRVLSFAVDAADDTSPYLGQDGHHIERGPGTACFVLSPAQARAVWSQTRAPGDSSGEAGELLPGDSSVAEPLGVAHADFRFLAVPLLPHGGGIFWGG